MKTVVIIPGLLGFSLDYTPIVSYLNKNGINDCHVFNYNHKEKLGEIEIGWVARDFDKFVKKLNKKKIYLIGVSAGGIIASYWLEFLNGKKICNSCITINAPFHGSYLAYMSKFHEINELRTKSNILKSLREKMSKSKVNYYGTWTPFDLVVIPGWSAYLNFFKKSKMIFSLHFLTSNLRATKQFILSVISN